MPWPTLPLLGGINGFIQPDALLCVSSIHRRKDCVYHGIHNGLIQGDVYVTVFLKAAIPQVIGTSMTSSSWGCATCTIYKGQKVLIPVHILATHIASVSRTF